MNFKSTRADAGSDVAGGQCGAAADAVADADVRKLKVGDVVLLDGVVFTAVMPCISICMMAGNWT